MFHPSTPLPIRSPRKRRTQLALVGLTVSALALSATPAWSQTTGVPSMADTAPSAAVDSSKLNFTDSSMLGDLAQATRSEVEAAKLALEKSQNANVKKYAQDVMEEHTKALTDVEQLGVVKNVKLPQGVGVVNKAKETALKALSGNTFDSQYLKRVGVGGHETTVELLQKIQKTAKDPELKLLADKLLPAMQRNLDTANQLVPA
jgi:putative membrane protein